MATELPTKVTPTKIENFDAVTKQIYQIFDPLIARLISRRDALVLKLSQLREDYVSAETTRIAAKQDLETAQQQLQEINPKLNKTNSIQQQAAQLYKQGLDSLATPTRLPHPLFQCPTLQTLQSLIEDFGEVVEWERQDYPRKIEPVLACENKTRGLNELSGSGLAIDELYQRIYVTTENRRVIVVSFEGEFLTQFGQDTLECPWGVALSEEYVFVTDRTHNALFQFNKNYHTLEISTGTNGTEEEQLNHPGGLSIDTNGDVFIADTKKNRISILSTSLKFKGCIGIGCLESPKDVKLTPDKVAVLDWSPSCVHLFSRGGDLLGCCVSQGGGRLCSVSCPFFFCLDIEENIIISDYNRHVIKIFSTSGQLIHTIGMRGEGKGQFIRPYGISISQTGMIFVLSNNPNYSLQCF